MPEKEVVERARRKLRSGKSPTTAAGELVREEMHHVREGKHGARSPQQAIAIGLSKARRAGVPLRPPKRGAAKRKTREAAATKGPATRRRAARKAAGTRRRRGRYRRSASVHLASRRRARHAPHGDPSARAPAHGFGASAAPRAARPLLFRMTWLGGPSGPPGARRKLRKATCDQQMEAR